MEAWISAALALAAVWIIEVVFFLAAYVSFHRS
jgi:hypothetical protein